MLDFLELEETVGRAWHRLAGDTRTWPRYPDAAVFLEDVVPVLSVCYRGFGGKGRCNWCRRGPRLHNTG